MRKQSRRLILSLISAMMATSLTACASNDSSQESTPEVTTTTPAVTTTTTAPVVVTTVATTTTTAATTTEAPVETTVAPEVTQAVETTTTPVSTTAPVETTTTVATTKATTTTTTAATTKQTTTTTKATQTVSNVSSSTLYTVLQKETMPKTAGTFQISRTYQNGKYKVGSINAVWLTSWGWNCQAFLFDANNNMLVSGGRYTWIDWVDDDLFVGYRATAIGRGEEYGEAEFINMKTGAITPINVKAQDNYFIVHPFTPNGLAAVTDTSWATDPYNIGFINKAGKLVVPLTDAVMSCATQYYKGPDGNYYAIIFDSKTSIAKKYDSNGKVVATFNIVPVREFAVYEINGIGHIFMQPGDSHKTADLDGTLEVYDLDMNYVKTIPYFDIYQYQDVHNDFYSPGKYSEDTIKTSIYGGSVIIKPSTNSGTAFDVNGESISTGTHISLYTAKKSQSTKNQRFVIEPVGDDKVVIWATMTKLQLRSQKADNGVYYLELGEHTTKSNQIFTLITNDDGTYSFKDNNGNYLTMAYGTDTSGTELVFAAYANGDKKQKFSLKMDNSELETLSESSNW